MKRPPDNLQALNAEYLAYWLGTTERDLNAEIQRVCGFDARFRRVLADAMRVEDEVQRRQEQP